MKSLKTYIKLLLSEGKNAPYEKNLTDDENFNGTSVLVPDDIKKKIFDYLASMGLSRR